MPAPADLHGMSRAEFADHTHRVVPPHGAGDGPGKVVEHGADVLVDAAAPHVGQVGHVLRAMRNTGEVLGQGRPQAPEAGSGRPQPCPGAASDARPG
ncbi:hypothetical protein, partial [Streptomyces sp. NL15-2K]|uniref:hypothetical protein n=1 Tax=Streptomyces sp. NL15-2K TaxID=376149 RepID=UPI001C0E9665